MLHCNQGDPGRLDQACTWKEFIAALSRVAWPRSPGNSRYARPPD
jgi:hypothetical protein